MLRFENMKHTLMMFVNVYTMYMLHMASVGGRVVNSLRLPWRRFRVGRSLVEGDGQGFVGSI